MLTCWKTFSVFSSLELKPGQKQIHEERYYIAVDHSHLVNPKLHRRIRVGGPLYLTGGLKNQGIWVLTMKGGNTRVETSDRMIELPTFNYPQKNCRGRQ